jgi:hypothetical protein
MAGADGRRTNKNPPPDAGDGFKNFLLFVYEFNSPIAGVILVMALCHPAARLGRAAR